MGVVAVRRFDVLLVALDPTQGAEIKKTRPCVVISPDEMNRFVKTLIVAPMTSKKKNYPTRVFTEFQKKEGEIILDQIRTIDKTGVIKKLGELDKNTSLEVLEVLSRIFT